MMSKFNILLIILFILAIIPVGTAYTKTIPYLETSLPAETVFRVEDHGQVHRGTREYNRNEKLITMEPIYPPKVIKTNPSRVRVPIDVPAYWIAIEFDQLMIEESINKDTFRLESEDGKPVAGTVISEGSIATFIPSESLDYATRHVATVKGGQDGVLSFAGIPLEEDVSWSFLTERLEDAGPLVYHSYKIDDDSSGGSEGNGDGNIDPGETIELTIFLGNQGEATASEISGALDSTDPDIIFSGNQESGYDNIIGWGTEPNTNKYQFSVDQDTACGHQIAFEHNISAAGSYSDIVTFTVPVTCNPPATPNNPSPGVGEVDVSLNPDLSISVSDPDGDELRVTFYGRELAPSTAGNFNIVVIPDTQYYTCDGNSSSCPNTPVSPYVNDGRIETFFSQTQWVVNNKDSIIYVAHDGDLVQNADWYEEEWLRADSAMDILETGTPDIAYGISFGNHDLRNLFGASSTVSGDTFLNQYFGSDRFQGRPYYAGHFSFNNNNHYVLFEKGNLAFIAIHLEYDREYEDAIVAWADNLLKQHPGRRGIVVRHAIIDEVGDFVSNGDRVYESLRDNPNLFLFLCGHIDGEYIRADQYNGQTRYTVLSDYQSEPNGGDGWLRVLQFASDINQITVRSYTTLYDQWDWDSPLATGQRELEYDMGYTTREIATIEGVPSGSVVSATWNNLLPESKYAWYVAVSDDTNTTISPIWHFTTGLEMPACHPLTLSYTGSGGVPLASPANSDGCNNGEYLPGETIDLTAFPAQGYRVDSWSGTLNDASTSNHNQVSMPSGEHTVIVNYVAYFNIYLPGLYNGEP